MNIDGSALEFLHVHPDLLKVFITHVFSSLYQCLELTGNPYSARFKQKYVSSDAFPSSSSP